MTVGRVVDLAEPAAELDLRPGFEAEAGKDQHAVVLERLEHRSAERVVARQPVGVDPEHLCTDRFGELVDRQETHFRNGRLLLGR